MERRQLISMSPMIVSNMRPYDLLDNSHGRETSYFREAFEGR